MEMYDRQGNVLPRDQWGPLFADKSYQIVQQDFVDDAHVSTVWLGLDHAFGGGPPLIFETMVFGGDFDEHCFRYSTEEAALRGHHMIVAALEGGKPLPDDLPEE